MCGIVGLFLKRPALHRECGAMLAGMLATMRDRGPDSAGFAIYASPGRRVKLTIRADAGTDIAALAQSLDIGCELRATHAVLHVAPDRLAAITTLLHDRPDIVIVGEGRSMELYKEVGDPGAVATRFRLDTMAGTHAVGHTRMATESAVTTDGAHPYSTGIDQCLVHNGSLSNHNAWRRRLAREGMTFRTENDTEVAASYISWRMREGADLATALASALDDLDGFYTFVVATRTGFAVLRDPISCKPAIMAETEDWVAFGSEYRALVDLPGVNAARVWEPEPARVYAWEHRA